MANPNMKVTANPASFQTGKPQTIVLNNKQTTFKNAQGQVLWFAFKRFLKKSLTFNICAQQIIVVSSAGVQKTGQTLSQVLLTPNFILLLKSIKFMEF